MFLFNVFDTFHEIVVLVLQPCRVLCYQSFLKVGQTSAGRLTANMHISLWAMLQVSPPTSPTMFQTCTMLEQIMPNLSHFPGAMLAAKKLESFRLTKQMTTGVILSTIYGERDS